MLSDVGSALAGLLALAIILMGSRYLLDPTPAAAGFGIPAPAAKPRPTAHGSPSKPCATSPSGSPSLRS